MEVALYSAHEQSILDLNHKLRNKAMPVVLIAGQLGSGKTTLLAHILKNKLNLNIVCLVNDLAQVPIDHEQLQKSDPTVNSVTLSNGCICHSIASKFEEEVYRVIQQAQSDQDGGTDYIVVETSGIADSIPLVEALQRRYGRMTRAHLEAAVLVVDADDLQCKLKGPLRTFLAGVEKEERVDEASGVLRAADRILWRQMQVADHIVLNKLDLLDEKIVQDLMKLLKYATPWAQVHRCEYCQVPIEHLLNVNLNVVGASMHEVQDTMYTKCARTSAVPRSVEEGLPPSTALEPECAQAHFGHTAMDFESDAPIRLAAFQDLVGGIGLSIVQMEKDMDVDVKRP